MDLSPRLEALFGYLYHSIRNEAEYEVKYVRGEETYPSLILGHSESRAVLAKYLTSDEAVDAFRRVMEIVGQSTIYSIMSILGFACEVDEGYRYALIDKETGEDLYPNCGYIDGWTQFAYDRDAALEEQQ